MTPNYALSLSFSGISLLTRAASVGGPAEGWYVLGEVPLDTDDLPSALAQLRAKAVSDLEMDGPETKLILPNEQIKFLSIGDDGSAPEAQAEAALAGATPYDVADLVFDVQRVGGLLNIAAVARETLAEAEAFARDNRFVPLSFVAMAPEDTFEGEPFFGPTGAALTQLTPGVAIERDAQPIVILDGPPPAPASAPQVPPAPEGIAEVGSGVEPAAREAAAPTQPSKTDAHEVQEAQEAAPQQTQTEANPAAPSAPRAAPAAAPSSAPTPVTLDYVERNDAGAPTRPAAAPKAPAAMPGASKPLTTSPQDAQAAEAAPAVAFASLRAERGNGSGAPQARAPSPAAQGHTPPLQGAQPSARITPKPLGAGTVASPLAPSRDAPAPQSPATDTAPETETSSKPPNGPSFANALKARALASFASRRSASGMAESAAPALGTKNALQAPAAQAADTASGSAVATVSSVLARAQTGLGRGVGFVSRRTSEIRASRAARTEERAAAAPASRRQGATAAALTAGNKMDEADRMTVFGARKSNPNRPVGGKPRFLGLMLTAALLLFLLGVAAWASVFIDDGISRFFSDDADAAATDTALTQPTIPDTIPAPISASPTPQSTAHAGVGSDAPNLQIPAGTEGDVSVAAPNAAPEASAPLTLPQTALEERSDTPDVETVLALGMPAVGTPPEAAASVSGLSKPMGQPMSDDAARTLYAATGIWQRAPLPPAELRQGLLGDLHIAALDGVISSRGQAPRPAPLTDAALTAVTPSPKARNLAAPALSAPNVPDVPGDSQQAARAVPQGLDTEITPGLTEPAQANPALRAIRPLARPASVAEAAPRALSPAETALAKVRPLARPKALEQTQAEDDAAQKELVAKALTEAAIAAAEEDARAAAEAAPESQLALAASTAPKPRPSNIQALVRRADRETDPQATQVAAVKPKTVKPVSPSKGSVTKNATQTNAINLRKVNLIGVYGKPSDRRALVRLANGRFKKVKVGDRIDGGRILAISDGQLRYQKGGRNLTLKMPQG